MMRGCAADLQVGTSCTAQTETQALLISYCRDASVLCKPKQGFCLRMFSDHQLCSESDWTPAWGDVRSQAADALYIHEGIRPIKV